MVQIFIDGKAVEVEEGITIIQACEQAGVEIPRFCYHEKLSIAGCNTQPTGNTLMDDEAARYGLFNEASPGWSEFDPYQGYDDMFGGNET